MIRRLLWLALVAVLTLGGSLTAKAATAEAPTTTSASTYDVHINCPPTEPLETSSGQGGGRCVAQHHEELKPDQNFFQPSLVAAKDGLTVAGERTTIHGAERLTQAGFDEETIAATKSGLITRQADGASVYLNEVSPGRYDFIVESDNGVVTAHRGWSFKSVARLAGNYGWEGWPP